MEVRCRQTASWIRQQPPALMTARPAVFVPHLGGGGAVSHRNSFCSCVPAPPLTNKISLILCGMEPKPNLPFYFCCSGRLSQGDRKEVCCPLGIQGNVSWPSVFSKISGSLRRKLCRGLEGDNDCSQEACFYTTR